MTHRLTESELAELECNADIYPHIGVIQHINLLRWAYEEIDRLHARADDTTGSPANLNAPWKLTFDSVEKGIVAVISDTTGNDLATSAPYRLPERGEPIPPTLSAMQVMRAAPEMLATISGARRDISDVLRGWDQPASKGQLKAAASDLQNIVLKAMTTESHPTERTTE